MAKTIRVAVIGAGGIARAVHLPALKEIPGCAVAALCDLDADRARSAAELFSVPKTYTLYREMLAAERPDAAFVLVQPDQAFRVALDCVFAGVPVFLEKPAGITLYQTVTLEREAAARGVPCQVGFNRRFIPLLGRVLEEMKPAGPLTQIDGWFYKRSDADFYGGCASAFECDTIHVIDLVRSLAGGKPRRAITLAARTADSPVENAWNCLVSFENGAVGTIHGNYATGGRVHGFALHAPGASAYINIGFGGEACEAKILRSGEAMFSLSAQGGRPPETLRLEGKTGEYFRYYGYYAEDAAFISSLQTGAAIRCDLREALETMRLVEMLKQNRMEEKR